MSSADASQVPRTAITAREAVLGRIRAANRAAAAPAPVDVPRDYRRIGDHPPGSPELVELLRDRLVDYRATVVDSAADGIPAAIAGALAGVGGPVVVPPGLSKDWCPDGVVDGPGDPVIDCAGSTVAEPDRLAAATGDAPAGATGETSRTETGGAGTTGAGTGSTETGSTETGSTETVGAELDRFAAVVTGCAAACAETGTIALDSSPDQGRRAITLVPDLHVCVVRADQVVHTVPELLAALTPDRPITFISGPSATSDIELQRVEGVHGPRTLIVVLVH